jgi:hypothetical protein
VLSRNALNQRLGFRPRELLKRGKPPANILLHIRGLPRQTLLDFSKPTIEIAHLSSEQDVPDSVEIAGAALVETRLSGFALLDVILRGLFFVSDGSHEFFLS